MNIDDLRTLLVVARSGSVTKAAASLRVTQPAATRRIQRLESELGVALIDRRARPYGLTVAGRHLVARLPTVLDALDALRQGLGMDDRAQPRFRVGIDPSLADHIADDLVRQLRRELPQLIPAVVTGWAPDLLRCFLEGKLDAAVMYLPDDDEFAPPSDAKLHIVGRLPLVAVGPRATASRDLPDAWILNATSCLFREALVGVLRRAGRTFHPVLEVDGIDRQLKLVAEGAGYGFVAEPFVHGSPVRSRLRLLRLPVPVPSLRLGVLYRPDAASAEAVVKRIALHLRRWANHGPPSRRAASGL